MLIFSGGREKHGRRIFYPLSCNYNICLFLIVYYLCKFYISGRIA